MGSHERLSADSVDQRECLEKTNFARDRLLEGARDHLQALCDETKILTETEILRPEFPISLQRLLFSDAKFVKAMLTLFFAILRFLILKQRHFKFAKLPDTDTDSFFPRPNFLPLMTDTESVFQSNFFYRYSDPQKLAKVLKPRGKKPRCHTLLSGLGRPEFPISIQRLLFLKLNF